MFMVMISQKKEISDITNLNKKLANKISYNKK